MRHLPLRSQILLWFTLPLLLAAGVSALVYEVLTANVATAEAVTASIQESAQISALVRAVVTAEASERGYAITGNEALLDRFQQARRTAKRQLGVLLAEADDEPDEADQLEKIDVLFERWLTEVAEPVVDARRGAPVGLAGEAARVYTRFLEVANAELRYRLEGSEEALRAWRRQLIGVKTDAAGVLASDLPEEQRAAWRDFLATSDAYELDVARSGPEQAGQAADALAATLADLALAARDADERALEIVRSGAGQALIAQIEQLAGAFRRQEQVELQMNIAASSASTRRALGVAVLGPVLTVVLGLVIVWLLLRGTVRAAALMARAAQGLAGGDLSQRVSLRRSDELGSWRVRSTRWPSAWVRVSSKPTCSTRWRTCFTPAPPSRKRMRWPLASARSSSRARRARFM